jgi:hypothetical protein
MCFPKCTSGSVMPSSLGTRTSRVAAHQSEAARLQARAFIGAMIAGEPEAGKHHCQHGTRTTALIYPGKKRAELSIMAGLGRNVEQGHSCDDQKEAADLGYAQGLLKTK